MFSHSTDTFVPGLRIGLIAIWAIGIGFFAHDGPQPIGDTLTQAFGVFHQATEEPSDERVIRVTLAPRAPIRAWQRTAELAREKGAVAVGVIGPALPKSQNFVTLDPKTPLLEELGLPKDKDGKHRRFQTQNSNGATFLTRLVHEAGQTMGGSEQRIPLQQDTPASITAAQLSALPGSALEGRIALVSGEAPWGTATLTTPLGALSIAEIFYRLLSGQTVKSFSPWTGLLGFGIAGIVLARLLEAPRTRTFRWVLGLSALFTVVFALSLLLGHAFPLDASILLLVTSGVFLAATRPAHMDSPPITYPLPSDELLRFHRACGEAALQQSGALAIWIAQFDGDWKIQCSAGDAGELPTQSVHRLLDPEAETAPEDSAFLAFPFSGQTPGVLLIQPGDQDDLDPHPIGTALAHVLNTQAGPLLSITTPAGSLVEQAWLENHSGGLYDAVGRVRLLHPSLRAWLLSQGLDPDSNLLEIADALEWGSGTLSRAWSSGESACLSNGEERFVLRRLLPPGGQNGLALEMAELNPSPNGQAG